MTAAQRVMYTDEQVAEVVERRDYEAAAEMLAVLRGRRGLVETQLRHNRERQREGTLEWGRERYDDWRRRAEMSTAVQSAQIMRLEALFDNDPAENEALDILADLVDDATPEAYDELRERARVYLEAVNYWQDEA